MKRIAIPRSVAFFGVADRCWHYWSLPAFRRWRSRCRRWNSRILLGLLACRFWCFRRLRGRRWSVTRSGTPRGTPYAASTYHHQHCAKRKLLRCHGLGSCGVRAATRSSNFFAASDSLSETSRKNCAVRFSVVGATSSSKYFRRRVISSSSFRPNSSNLSIGPLRRIARRISGIIGMRLKARKEDG